MQTKSITCLASLIIACAFEPALAQAGNFARWEVSLDNGNSWQQGAVSAPQSQASVLVRMRWQHLTNGSVTPQEQYTNIFDAASFEAYSTTAMPTTDTASNLLQMALVQTGVTQLRSTPLITSRRVGSVLAIDRTSDNAPLGGNLGVFVNNYNNGIFNATTRQDIPLLQYTLNLDGSSGDRVLSGLFIPFNTGHSFTLGFDQISVANRVEFIAADITHLPTTLTIIPTPTTLAIFTITSLFATRRRRS
jgi:hypothetical protein